MIALIAGLAVLTQDSVSYARGDAWLCRPGRQDACAVELTTSVVAAGGRVTTEPWSADPKAAIDCFYVYPTVSRDTSARSDMIAGDEERDVVRQQFARFASVCRPYAPVYRQVTMRGLRPALASGDVVPVLARGIGYSDVVAAWRHYLANDNRGRGVVLIGHSQGAVVLEELIRREIEGTATQSRVVSAMLIGTNVAVPKGKDVGGAFRSMPLCKRAGQTGCIISYATFRSTVPPAPRALFGRVAGEGMEAACTDPTALAGANGALHAYFLGAPGRAGQAARAYGWVTDGTAFTTPFVSVPGLLTGRCVTDSLGSRLEVTVHADTADARADDIPGDIGRGTPAQAQWGLHLVDVHLAAGNLLEIVRRQAAAFRAAGR